MGAIPPVEDIERPITMLSEADGLPWFVIPSQEHLDEVLQKMNEDGNDPVLIGFDARGRRFLTYGCAPCGDDWAINVVLDDPSSSDFAFDEKVVGQRCPDCGYHGRLPMALIEFPVVVT